MAIKDQIERIIQARQERGESLRQRKAALQELKAKLKSASSNLVLRSGDIKDERLREQYGPVFAAVDTRRVERAADQAMRRMDEGIQRFGRDYISIATVGKERQGKSQLLQSVGDLDNSIIHAYDATSCTGATSIIWNSPNMQRGTVRVTITFRQPAELLEIVTPYIRALDPSYLENNPLQFDDIGYIQTARLAMKAEQGNADQATALRHLTNIVEHFDEIRDLFGASPITLTDPDLIKTYVAQNNGKGADDPNVEFYFKYLAVSRADIYCPFFADTGRVRLVDTVGIGDTKYGIEDMMLNTVDKECDAAIVVTRPISGIQVSDLELYNSLREKFKDRDTSKWLFYLVNHFKGQNDNTVDAFCGEILSSKWAVAACSVVDASDQAAVRDQFLMPLLKKLLASMDDIDGAYLAEIDQAEEAVWRELQAFLDALPPLETVNIQGVLGKETAEKGKRCFNRMTADLREAVIYWSQEREKPNTALWNSVQSILNDLDKIIPTPEKINAIAKSDGGLVGESVWAAMLHYVRNEVTDRLIAIDGLLEKETREFKNSLVRTLYHELRQLSPTGSGTEEPDENCDMVEWLKTILDEVLAGSEDYEQIRKAFHFLYQFEFNTRAQLIQVVRQQMYIINPVCREYAKPTFNFNSQGSDYGSAVHFYLTSRMSVVEDELRYHLAKLYRTPNQAFYAAAEEFYDRLTFASDLSRDYLVSMSDVWGYFFQEYSSKLWKDDTERYDVVNQLIRQYNQMITELRACLEGAT